MSQHKSDVGGFLNDIENQLNTYLVKKAPALPDGLKEFLVKIAPYFMILGILSLIPLVLWTLGLTNIYSQIGMHMPMNSTAVFGRMFWLHGIIVIAVVILYVMALPGLFKREKRAWNFLFYASLINIISTIFNLTTGGIIATIFGFYILFQVREKYKN